MQTSQESLLLLTDFNSLKRTRCCFFFFATKSKTKMLWQRTFAGIMQCQRDKSPRECVGVDVCSVATRSQFLSKTIRISREIVTYFLISCEIAFESRRGVRADESLCGQFLKVKGELFISLVLLLCAGTSWASRTTRN